MIKEDFFVVLNLSFESYGWNVIDHIVRSYLGIRRTVLDWFKSYLSDHYQSVCIDGTFSSPRNYTLVFLKDTF